MSAKATVSKGNLATNTNDLKSARVSGIQTTGAGAAALAEQLGVTPAGAEEPETQPKRAVTPYQGSAANPYADVSGGAIQGEFGAEDDKRPQLKIVNGSGELSQKYNQGALLLNSELLWLPPNLLATGTKNPTLIFVPIMLKKQWRQNLTPDEVAEGMMPRIVNSEWEAKHIGGTTNWNEENTKPRWSPSAPCIFLIQEPEHQDRPPEDRHSSFALQLDDKNWTVAIYYAGGMAYNESARVIFNASKSTLVTKTGMDVAKRWWSMQVVKKKVGNFGVYVPACKLTNTSTGPEALEYIKGFLASMPKPA